MLVTSGLDGIYLPGFPVAKVSRVERDSAYSFARIFCDPIAGVENFGEVFVLNPRSTLAPTPVAVDRTVGKDDRSELRPKKTKRVVKGN